MTADEFDMLYALADMDADAGTVTINGTELRALVSGVSDELLAMLGGTLDKQTYIARVIDDELTAAAGNTTARELLGLTLSYNGENFRILKTSKHPRSEIRHLTISEK